MESHENDVSNLTRKYSNSILLFIGEGNFSFSASLAASEQFSNLNCDLIATDFVPELKDELEEEMKLEGESGKNDNLGLGLGESKRLKPSYDLALVKENVAILKSLKYEVLFDVDASKLHEHAQLVSLLGTASKRSKEGGGLLRRIHVIFNFPHAKSKKMKIDLCRDLLRGFFMSCEKFSRVLNDNRHKGQGEGSLDDKDNLGMEVLPIVSLCSGQCGIPEVDPVSRSWGNSWQVNDMAAHGNFVCTSICDFHEWDLFKMLRNSHQEGDTSTSSQKVPNYQSSYYRLQSGVSFTTKDGLTLGYEHRREIDPSNSSRLEEAILNKFTSEDCQEEIVSNFVKAFGTLSGEKVASRNKEISKVIINNDKRPYFHMVSVSSQNSEDVPGCISNYLNDSQISGRKFEVKVQTDRSKAKFLHVINLSAIKEKADEMDSVLVGTLPIDDDAKGAAILYLDQLLELKYDLDYRTLLSRSFPPSKFPSGGRESLYPHIHEFHISFWLSSKFTMDSFMEVLLDVYGLMLKTLDFVEEYLDKNNDGRKSTCWRIQVQSLDLPLCRLMAHRIYLKLREELASRLGVIVR